MLTEQQKQIAREAYDNDNGTFDYPYDGVYAAVEAVLAQHAGALTVRQRNEITVRLNNQYTLRDIKDFWDAHDSVLAQRTPATASAPQSTADVDPNADSSPAVLKAQIRFWKKFTEVRTAALAEARRGMYSAAEIEKAIRAEWARAEMSQVYFIAAVLARLSAKEQPII